MEPLPPAPDPGLVNAVRYAIAFSRAWWQRGRAIKHLQTEIASDTDALDVVLGSVGRDVRALEIDNPVLAAENAAISAAERRKAELSTLSSELVTRQAEEQTKFEELERERTLRLTAAEKAVEVARAEVSRLEAERRGLREQCRDVERRQKAYLRAAVQRDTDAGKSPLGDSRSDLRHSAEDHRREAAALEPERQELERQASALDRPLVAAQSTVLAAKADFEQQRHSLQDAREGHRHRLAELESEQGRASREHDVAVAEINRRLVTLGTLVNLHRVEREEFVEAYRRIDRLRDAINARTAEIDRLTAERQAHDRSGFWRGQAVIGGALVIVIVLVVVLLAVM